MQSSRRVIYVAVASNASIAVAKFVAAALTGSSAILSEGIHSVVDTLNETLLLLGQYRSRKRPDARHPFGHGKEMFFWSLIVAVVLFGVGGGMAIYEGITHLRDPEPLRDARWAYAVLAIAALFEGYSFTVAYSAIGAKRDHGQPLGWWRRIRRSKDPALFIVFLEDMVALVGIIVAFFGVLLGHVLRDPRCDGIASIVIGVLLAAIAIALAHECRGLLVGESATPGTVKNIHHIIERDSQVRAASRPKTMHLSPDTLLVNAKVEVEEDVSADEQVATLERVTAAIRREHPEAEQISLQPTRPKARKTKRSRRRAKRGP